MTPALKRENNLDAPGAAGIDRCIIVMLIPRTGLYNAFRDTFCAAKRKGALY